MRQLVSSISLGKLDACFYNAETSGVAAVNLSLAAVTLVGAVAASIFLG